MGRLPRFNAPDTVFHVMARGNDGQAVFKDGDDLSFFCAWLRRLKDELGFELFAYCLMTNHVHLLLKTGTAPVSEILHRLLSVHARRFNSRHRRTGHLFQGRFLAIPCQESRYFAAALSYIHRNPVAAQLVKTPEDWKFSGHREFLGAQGQRLVDVARALALLSPDAPSVKDYFALFSAGRPEDPLAALAEEVAAKQGVLLSELRQGAKDRAVASARRLFALRASENGYSGAELARFLGCTRQSVYEMLRDLGRPVNRRELVSG